MLWEVFASSIAPQQAGLQIPAYFAKKSQLMMWHIHMLFHSIVFFSSGGGGEG